MFTGLSAFPLTPFANEAVDEGSFAGLIERLAATGVDSITVLGSTGSYAYLSTEERARLTRLGVKHAGGKPVLAGIGALRTADVLANARSAEQAGVSGLLLAPMSYQPLTDDDVFGLFQAVTAGTDLPVIVYDNPGTTHFTFSTGLYGRIAELPGIASIKIPGVPAGAREAAEHIRSIRAVLPAQVSIGVSGDAAAARGLLAGCDAWYSVIAGTLPDPALRIMRAAREGRRADAEAESAVLEPLWQLFAEFGSLRVTAAIAEQMGLVPQRCLPLPLRGLDSGARARVAGTLGGLGLLEESQP